MKTPAEIARAVMEANYGADSAWADPNRYGEAGFTLALVEDGVTEERVERLLIDAIAADRAQPERDGTLHAAAIAALRDRIDSDHDEAEGYDYRDRAIAWIENNPDAFWDEFGGPLLDDLERRHYDTPRSDDSRTIERTPV